MKNCLAVSTFLIVLSALCCGINGGYSYAYNPSTEILDTGTFGITPYIFAPSFNPLNMGSDIELEYGIFSNADITVDAADLTFAPAFSYNFSWVMLRYDFGFNNIAALEASQYLVSPQYHFFWENNKWAFELNILAEFTYTNFSAPVFGAYAAPVYKITKDIFVYLELDPFYTVGQGFSLAVLPGVWFWLGDFGQISLAVTLSDVTGTFTPGAALWYTLTFNLSGKKAADEY